MTAMAPLEDTRVRALLPTPAAAVPPVTRRRIRRDLAVYAVLWLAGLLPVLLEVPARWAATGLGLTLPGAGLWYGGHPVLAVIALLGVGFAVVLWWMLGPVLLPPLVWLVSAALGGALAHDSRPGVAAVCLLVVPLATTATYAVHRIRHARHARRGAQLNERLAQVEFTVTGSPGPDVRVPVAEHTPDDLAHLRFALDLALQPLDRFDGFDRLDQFREGALRYQLCALGWSLSMANFTRTPAFTGYLAQAQRNAIEKQLDRKVWGYWALENLWGNLSLRRDPVDNPENIMMTGYHGLMIGMYAALNDDRYSRPGSLTYRWSDHVAYPHDVGSLAARTHRNMANATYTLFPCEPNWIYTVCNTMGMNTLLSHDRDHGTRFFAELEPRLRAAYETEFLRPDGRVIGVRSNHLGLSWNFWSGEAVQLTTAYWLHAAFPEIAQRTWWLVRETALEQGADSLRLPPGAANRLDPGNYRFGHDTYGQVITAMAARELGDEEIARTALRTLDTRKRIAESNGARRYTDASVFTNLYANLARFSRYSAMRDLLVHGAPAHWRTGPVLADTAYPEVLVARAVTDGTALDLVLRPGTGPVRATLRIERLEPRRGYRVNGATTPDIIATDRGDARLEIDLGDRHEIRIEPR